MTSRAASPGPARLGRVAAWPDRPALGCAAAAPSGWLLRRSPGLIIAAVRQRLRQGVGQACHRTPSWIVKDGMRTRSVSAPLGVVIGAGAAGPAASPLMNGEPGAAGMLWLWALVADRDWSADEGQGRP